MTIEFVCISIWHDQEPLKCSTIKCFREDILSNPIAKDIPLLHSRIILLLSKVFAERPKDISTKLSKELFPLPFVLNIWVGKGRLVERLFIFLKERKAVPVAVIELNMGDGLNCGQLWAP